MDPVCEGIVIGVSSGLTVSALVAVGAVARGRWRGRRQLAALRKLIESYRPDVCGDIPPRPLSGKIVPPAKQRESAMASFWQVMEWALGQASNVSPRCIYEIRDSFTHYLNVLAEGITPGRPDGQIIYHGLASVRELRVKPCSGRQRFEHIPRYGRTLQPPKRRPWPRRWGRKRSRSPTPSGRPSTTSRKP